jgi:hypothetical protein
VQTIASGTNWIKLPVMSGFDQNKETLGAIRSV